MSFTTNLWNELEQFVNNLTRKNRSEEQNQSTSNSNEWQEGNSLKDIFKDISKNISKDISKDISKNISRDVSRDVSKAIVSQLGLLLGLIFSTNIFKIAKSLGSVAFRFTVSRPSLVLLVAITCFSAKYFTEESQSSRSKNMLMLKNN